MSYIRHSIRSLWILGAVWLGLPHATAPANFSSSAIRRIEVSNQGTLVGFVVQLSRRPNLSLWVSGTGQVQWLFLSMSRSEFVITPNGLVMPGQLLHKGSIQLTFDDYNRIEQIANVRFHYQTENRARLQSIQFADETVQVQYNLDGRFRSVGNINFTYLNNGLLQKVHHTELKYDRSTSRLVKIGPLQIQSQLDGRVVRIGGATMRYHSVRGHVVSLDGSESRAQIHILWYNVNLCNTYQRRGGNSFPGKLVAPN